jgi:hypothetical protein
MHNDSPKKEWSGATATPGGGSAANPEQASQYLRFALSQLAGKNGHHTFERLCFQLARRRVYSNVIPATGPVSAGGDQGADFETYPVGKVTAVGTESPFFARATDEKVLFACSIEKNVPAKVREDLKKAAAFQEKVKRVVFFSNWDVPVGKRHALQKTAEEQYGIALDIFDSHAISDWLADPELFWIAEEYLSVPSEFVLARRDSKEKWYEEAVELKVDQKDLRESEFYQLRDAVRFATFSAAHKSDLPGLLGKLRLFRQHRSLKIQRRAFYEDYVASLRGLEAVSGFTEGLEHYIGEVAKSDDPSELEDGSIIVSYSLGAMYRGLLDVALSTVVGWRKLLLARVEELLKEPGIAPGRASSLMFTKGFLLLFDWIEEQPSPGEGTALFGAKALGMWRMMLREVRQAPLFPLERFGKLLNQLAAEINRNEEYARVVKETGKLLAARFGKHKLAEQAFERAQSYYKAGLTLEAIEELQTARSEAFTEERGADSVQFCTFLAKMYSEVGLHFAAKWYALGAAFAALKLKDDDLRAQAYRGITEAASSDHATGASMEFFLTARVFFFVSHEFSMAGSEKTREFEWARIDFYSLLLARTASYLNEALFRYLKDTVLRSFGTDAIYEESASRLDAFFGKSGFQGVVERAVEEGIQPPFSDAGPKRHVGWEQLGIRWFVEWENEYETALAAESFCATLQILLADLRKEELSLLASEVHLKIEVHEGKLQIVDDSDNKKILLLIRIPRMVERNSEGPDRTGIVQGVVGSALKTVSAMPREKFLDLYERRMTEGLNRKLLPYAEYDRLFREFYSEREFREHYAHSRDTEVRLPAVAGKTAAGLDSGKGIHREYSKEQSERVIRRRYKLLEGQLKYTLPRLLGRPGFLTAAQELRHEGWKDWHILQAVGSIRLNYLLQQAAPHERDIHRLQLLSKELFERDELETDPVTPEDMFTTDALKKALVMTQLSTLKGLGFECPQQAPNFEGVDGLLRRFNYWTDDVEHPVLLPS